MLQAYGLPTPLFYILFSYRQPVNDVKSALKVYELAFFQQKNHEIFQRLKISCVFLSVYVYTTTGTGVITSRIQVLQKFSNCFDSNGFG